MTKCKNAFKIFSLFAVLLLAGCQMPIQKVDPLALDSIAMTQRHQYNRDGAISVSSGSENLYGSNRAHRVGDLLTIHLEEDISAQNSVSTNTSRSGSATDTFDLAKPAISASVTASGSNKFDGSGKSQQSNKISGNVTVTVVRVLPGQKLVVKGYKTIMLSAGVEKIGISGVVREEDINTLDNSVYSSQVADAHIAYLNRGDLNASSQKGWLSRVVSSAFWPV